MDVTCAACGATQPISESAADPENWEAEFDPRGAPTGRRRLVWKCRERTEDNPSECDHTNVVYA